MANELIVGLVGAVGAVLGASAQAISGRFLARRKFREDSRYEAYSLFLSSLSRLATTAPNSTEHRNAVTGLIEAKCRIALYASKAVVRRLAHFSWQNDRIDPYSYDDLADVIGEMRADSGGGRIDNLSSELMGLLFGSMGKGVTK